MSPTEEIIGLYRANYTVHTISILLGLTYAAVYRITQAYEEVGPKEWYKGRHA